MSVPACLHTTELDIRWGDLDAFNHVNNAVYLDYIQEARLRWLTSLADGWHDDDISPVVVNSTCNYRQPVVWPARIRIDLHVARRSDRSLTLGHRIVDGQNPDTVYSDGHVVMVWINRRSGTAVPLPAVVGQAVAPA